MAIYNEQTNALLYKNIYLSDFILERVDVSVVCERWAERHIPRGRRLLLPISPPRSQGVPPLSKLVRDASGRLRVPLNLSAWFSSRDLLPITHLFDLSALIVLSCLLIKMWQLAKHSGSLWTNRKSMVYVK